MMRLRLALFATTMFACKTESPRAIERRPPDAAQPTTSSGARTDGCRQIAGQPPDTAIEIGTPAANEWRRRVARGITFACTIHPSLVLRIAVAGDTSNPSLDSVIVFASNDSTHPLQLLHRVAGDAEMPQPHFTDVVRTIDLDADGWRDLLVGRFWGATGNTGYDVWHFDPSTRRFIVDSTLSRLVNPDPVTGRPCVTTYSNSSVADDEMGIYCLHAGRWRLDSAESHTWLRDSNAIRHDIVARRGDSLVLVRTETKRDAN
jgi:hypothetical protein